MSVEKKIKFKVERISKFIFDYFDTQMIVKVLNFSSTIQTVLRDITPFSCS